MAEKKVTDEQKQALYKMLGACLVLITLSFILAYSTTSENVTIMEFFGFSSKYGIGSILVGLVSSTIFGMVDNGGLFFGMDALDPFLPGNSLEKAGLGNTFSDFLGAFLGTFIGLFIQNITGIEDTPLYTDAIGIVIGCLIGLYGAKAITGK